MPLTDAERRRLMELGWWICAHCETGNVPSRVRCAKCLRRKNEEPPDAA